MTFPRCFRMYVCACVSVCVCEFVCLWVFKYGFLLAIYNVAQEDKLPSCWELSCTHWTNECWGASQWLVWVVMLHLISWALSCNCHQRRVRGRISHNTLLASHVYASSSHVCVFSLSYIYIYIHCSFTYIYCYFSYIYTFSSHIHTVWLIQC